MIFKWNLVNLVKSIAIIPAFNEEIAIGSVILEPFNILMMFWL